VGVTHQYRRPGWYKVDVSYYYTPEKRWVVFDSAQLRVAAAGAKADAALLSMPLVSSLAGGVLCLVALGFAALRFRTRNAQTAVNQDMDKRRAMPAPRRAAGGRGR
jgi:hypothetical protein